MADVFDLPDDHWIRVAHRKSIRHRQDVVESKLCGCFYCQEMFGAETIEKWTDNGETALCPHCSIDSVIGDRSGFDITAAFLREMNKHWFLAG